MSDLQSYVEQLGAARRASRLLATLDGDTKVAILRQVAASLRENASRSSPPTQGHRRRAGRRPRAGAGRAA